jgi:hypothetical protein
MGSFVLIPEILADSVTRFSDAKNRGRKPRKGAHALRIGGLVRTRGIEMRIVVAAVSSNPCMQKSKSLYELFLTNGSNFWKT